MNNLNMDLRGKVVIVNSTYKGTERERRFLCEEGFGCDPGRPGGRRILGKFLVDGEECSVAGEEVLRLSADQSYECPAPRDGPSELAGVADEMRCALYALVVAAKNLMEQRALVEEDWARLASAVADAERLLS